MILKKSSNLSLVITAVGIATVVSVFASTVAHASTLPTLTATVMNASNATTTVAQIGSLVHVQVMVASSTGSTTPSGAVDFAVYKNTSCSNVGVVQSNASLINGMATSMATTVPASGLSYAVHYDGDTNYPTADGVCTPLTAAASSTTLTTTLSTTSVLTGASVHDSATLTNATSNAGGTVTYSAYTNNACTLGAMSAGTVAVTNAIVPNSNALIFSTPGTFYWQAVYSGDAQNAMATSSCGSEVLAVGATSTPPIVITPGMIGGTVFNDLNKNDVKDASDPGLAGWAVWLHLGSQKYASPVVATTVTDANGNYSFGNLATSTYFVEEQEQTGWNQTTNDMVVTLDNTHTSADVDFANTVKANGGGNGGGDQGGGHGGDHGGGHDGNDDGGNGGGDGGTATSTDHGDHGHGSFGDTFPFGHEGSPFRNGFPFGGSGSPFGNGFPFGGHTTHGNH